MTGRVVDVEGADALAEASDRFCPVCGAASAVRFCAVDGTATVRRVPQDARLPDLQPGSVVQGRYRVQQRIGRGGFGAVYSATHTGTGQEVALKLLSVDTGADNLEQVRRFWQEAQITARLRHENTVRVFDVGQSEEGAFYLAMEHLRGQTLQGRLEALAAAGGWMAEAEAIAIGVAICRSLQEAHGKGLVHRDLKPGNVMLLDGEGEEGAHSVKVLDFGIARSAGSSLTGSGTILGTPAYMSPEQCRGDPIDGRSDLYALGALLYRCVAGRPPFVDPNPLTVMFQHAATPPADPRQYATKPLSEAMVAVLLRALAKEPGQRFADARGMREALEGIAAGEVPAIAEDGAAPPTPVAAPQPALAARTPGATVAAPAATAGTPRLWPWLLALATGLLATAAYFAQREPEAAAEASADAANPVSPPSLTRPSADVGGADVAPVDVATVEIKAPPTAAPPRDTASAVTGDAVGGAAAAESAASAAAGAVGGSSGASDSAATLPAGAASVKRPTAKGKQTASAKRVSADRSVNTSSGRRDKSSGGGRDARPAAEPAAPTPALHMVPPKAPQNVAPKAPPKPAPLPSPERPGPVD